MAKKYKVVRFCKTCKTRFFVDSTVSRKIYCDACSEKKKAAKSED